MIYSIRTEGTAVSADRGIMARQAQGGASGRARRFAGQVKTRASRPQTAEELTEAVKEKRALADVAAAAKPHLTELSEDSPLRAQLERLVALAPEELH
jgi:hypothetical protein